MKNIILFSLLSLLIFTQCNSSKKSVSDMPTTTAPGVKFVISETLTEVLEEAERENKIVFVDFYTTWCLPCRMMDEDVFPNKETAKFMNSNFINYKIDAEKGNGPNLALVYNVQAFPTLLFMDSKGRILESKVGAAFHTELRQMGERALNSQQ